MPSSQPFAREPPWRSCHRAPRRRWASPQSRRWRPGSPSSGAPRARCRRCSPTRAPSPRRATRAGSPPPSARATATPRRASAVSCAPARSARRRSWRTGWPPCTPASDSALRLRGVGPEALAPRRLDEPVGLAPAPLGVLLELALALGLQGAGLGLDLGAPVGERLLAGGHGLGDDALRLAPGVRDLGGGAQAGALQRGAGLDARALGITPHLRLEICGGPLPRDELLLGLARGAPAAALAEPLAHELQVAVDLLGVVAAPHPPERALDDEQRAGVADSGHPCGVRGPLTESCAARTTGATHSERPRCAARVRRPCAPSSPAEPASSDPTSSTRSSTAATR